MKRSQSSAVNMKLKKGATDTSAMTNETSFPDNDHHRRYFEPALDLKPQEDPEEKKQRLYKTEICRNWEEQNACRYGDKCQYAHGEEELRYVKRHPRYKTIYCQTFETLGTCPYGIRCTFLHESAPHDPQPSFDAFKSDLPMISPTPASESTSHLSVSDNQVHSSSSSHAATDYSSWTQSRFVPQSTQYIMDDTTSPLANQSSVSPLSSLSPLSLLPRPSVSSSSSSSSSSIFSASSSTILPSLCPPQQAPQRLNVYQDYYQNRLGSIDDYQKQPQHWHQPYFENDLPRQHQEQGPKFQKYQLPGTRSPLDLFADGDGFHSALGVVPPPTSSTVSPSSSFFSRRPASNLPTCTSSSTNFVNYKYRLIN